MADEVTTPTPDPVHEPEAPNEKSATDDLGDGGKKALEAERRDKRAAEKRANELEARLKQFEDRDKTEAQKLADRAEAAEKRALEVEARALRLEVASEKGLNAAQAKRLVGSTREELEADADELLETFASSKRAPSDIGQGARPAALPTDPRARDLAQIEADLKAGTRR